MGKAGFENEQNCCISSTLTKPAPTNLPSFFHTYLLTSSFRLDPLNFIVHAFLFSDTNHTRSRNQSPIEKNCITKNMQIYH
ncbi:MAG TPA: hypothetical protein V6D28_02230 [Leptolyngbyaceae cyanobacterium]